MTRSPARERLRLLGIGVAACAACGAGPLVGVLAGVGLAGMLSTLAIGAAGLLAPAVAVTLYVASRRRRSTCGPATSGQLAVAPPVRRT
jgi:hypothetical protein